MVNGKVTDFLEVTLDNGEVISEITDLELSDIRPDDNREDMYYVLITNALNITEAVLSNDDYFLLLDDLGK